MLWPLTHMAIGGTTYSRQTGHSSSSRRPCNTGFICGCVQVPCSDLGLKKTRTVTQTKQIHSFMHSFICLSLTLYNLFNCQLHYLLNTKINIIIINGSYSKNEFVICLCMKVTAYRIKWQNGGFQSHIWVSISKVLRYDACGSSERTEMHTWL